MDVEGAEYGVLDDMVTAGIRPGQVLVEFHHHFAGIGLDETVRSATVSMTVNYTGFATQSALLARAQVRRKGKRIASISVEIIDDSGALVADALVTYKIA